MSKSPTPIRNEKDFLRKNRSSTEYHSTIWAILFYNNLLITIYMFYYTIDQTIGFNCCFDIIFSKYKNLQSLILDYPDFNNDEFYQIFNFVKYGLIFSLIGTIGANILHFIYAIILPSLYIYINLFANMILFFLPLPFIVYKYNINFSGEGNQDTRSIVYFIIGVIIAIIGIILFFYRRRFVKTSASMMKSSSRILLKHPSLFLIEIIQSILLLIINSLYVIGITISQYYSAKLNLNPTVYIYATFSYYWILMTTYYVTYMTISGVVGYEFYLGNHSSMPKLIVFYSFRRALTYQFGCACYAGLILSLIHVLKTIIDWLKPKDKKERYSLYEEKSIFMDIIEFVKTIIYYLLYIIIFIIERMIRSVSKHALIYCSIFGVSFSEACRRWKKQSFSDKFTKLQHSIIISGSLFTNYFISSIFAVIISLYLCFKYFPDFQLQSKFSYITIVSTIVLMASFYYVLSSLITTTSDTLYLCFLEQPQLLNKKYNSLYKSLSRIKKE